MTVYLAETEKPAEQFPVDQSLVCRLSINTLAAPEGTVTVDIAYNTESFGCLIASVFALWHSLHVHLQICSVRKIQRNQGWCFNCHQPNSTGISNKAVITERF